MKIESWVNLQAHHTFGVSVRAQEWCVVDTLAQLPDALDTPLPVLFLGEGSNVLFRSDFYGRVICLRLTGKHVVAEDTHHVWVEVAAGENWHQWVAWSVAQGWSGLENLALIPGCVGATPIQNVGAYGVEVAERIVSVRYWARARGQYETLQASECQFAYRDSVFKQALAGQAVITAVTFRLDKQFTPVLGYGDLAHRVGETPTALMVFEAVCAIRREKLPDPAVLGSAGSFFKNPLVSAAQAQTLRARYSGLVSYPQADGTVKLAAGWLIDQSGWKGVRQGDAGVHAAQALVLVNYGAASGAQIWALAQAICADVKAKFGVELTVEPHIL